MVDQLVEVVAEPSDIYRWRGPEERGSSVGGDEAVASQRGELADRNASARDDEAFTVIEPSHDLPAVVAQFALGDLAAHASIVAPGATARIRRHLEDPSSPPAQILIHPWFGEGNLIGGSWS